METCNKECEKIFSFEDVIILPVVSPLRTKDDINNIIKSINKIKKKTVITITESTGNPYFNMVFDKKKNLRKLSLKSIKRSRMLQNFLIFA